MSDYDSDIYITELRERVKELKERVAEYAGQISSLVRERNEAERILKQFKEQELNDE